MKRTLSAVALVAAASSTVMAWDEYGALSAKKLEADVMINYVNMTGSYDEDGKKQDLPSDVSASGYSPVLQLKYGIIDGLDAELTVPYVSSTVKFGDEEETTSGLDAPNFAVKYTHASGFGGFIGVDLPFGSEDIVGKEPSTSFEVALQYIKTFGQVSLTDFVMYSTTLEKDDVKPADMLEIYVKPQYNVNDKIGPYLGIDYQMNIGKEKTIGFDEETFETTSVEVDPKTSLLTLKPGLNYIVNEAIGVEANVPVTVMGKNNAAAWGLYAGFYYTIGL